MSDLIKLLKRWDKWESDFLRSDETEGMLCNLPDELYEDYLDLQKERYRILNDIKKEFE